MWIGGLCNNLKVFPVGHIMVEKADTVKPRVITLMDQHESVMESRVDYLDFDAPPIIG